MVVVAACGSVHNSDPAAGGDAGIGSPSPDAAPAADAAVASELASCAQLAKTCGSATNDSCCDSPLVTGGSFARSYDDANDASSGTTSFPATVGTFRLDKYEITVGRFRAFVAAGLGTQASPPADKAGTHASIPGSGWDPNWDTNLVASTPALIAAVACDPMFQTWTDTAGANETKPMNCLSWYEAAAFCAWDGGYLPTEAEWNYAAAGGDQQRPYPWSIPSSSLAITADDASYNNGTDCVGDGLPGCALSDLLAVGTTLMGNGRWGQEDLAGNVLEWVLDWAAAYAATCDDCANLTPAAHREVRGGSYDSSTGNLRTGFRLNFVPTDRSSLIGARCARAP
ncbi:MAG TPA: formylglycine-generating enzyme family protein [Kofleriaceae bacterium]|jgi:formylglycine-generating enzyme required for sulfatase activity|nr:formylglycine-generating enzyme family protein [Kofleriaceae bacterium]